MHHYILEGREVKEVDALEWAAWFERNRNDRQIARDETKDVLVSTVFIGLYDQMFETMVFGGLLHDYQRRCDTYEEALIQHEAVRKAAHGNS
jgi:alpha-L-arabinofuranosidase